jgi:predicted neuraminidase
MTATRPRWALWILFATLSPAQATEPPGVIASEFIYDLDPPTRSCHASTLVETRRGLVAAWFGGTAEGQPDVAIYLARQENGVWSKPVKVFDGVQADGRQFPCWNPVLFRPEGGPLLLFAKIGPRPSTWWGVLATSADEGITWTKPERLPDGILGPIKNKPIRLLDGSLLCPSSTEDPKLGWRVTIERTPDLGRTWTQVGPLNDGKTLAAIQPSFLTYPDGKLQLVCRTEQDRIAEAFSTDQGKTWSPMTLTPLPNPKSGIDAVTLADGRQLLVYNPVTKGRTPLVVATSEDGKTWQTVLTLEDQPGEYSYPAVIQGAAGVIHVSYTWKRQKIKHVAINPKALPR